MTSRFTVLLPLACLAASALAVPPRERPRHVRSQPSVTGVLRSDARAFQGYTLLAPISSMKTYLIDMQGRVVHSWKSDAPPGQAAYLLENGDLLRCEHDDDNEVFEGGGKGGRIRAYGWDGTVRWDYRYSDENHCQHHDIEPLPNGNFLLIAWERKSPDEALAAGRDPQTVPEEGLWPDHVVELKPERPHGAAIVWEWHVWDHLIQEQDPNRANHGVVAEHPELIDINGDASSTPLSQDERRRLEALGYMPVARRPARRPDQADWNHVNSISYNAQRDQILLSVHAFSEIWVIDHSTTSKQAAGHTGGRSGKGGDLLYRWGNPQAYHAGTRAVAHAGDDGRDEDRQHGAKDEILLQAAAHGRLPSSMPAAASAALRRRHLRTKGRAVVTISSTNIASVIGRVKMKSSP